MTSGGTLSPPAPRRLELDGLRGIAILMVLACHTNAPAARWVSFGWSGVDLFFVLSGFLITGVLLDGAGDRNRIRTFYIRRALRILPLSYVAIVVAIFVLPVLAHSLADDSRRLAAHQWWLWTYTANWPIGLAGSTPEDPMPNLTHFWSLAIEEQFYLAWPFVVWYASRKTAMRVAWVAIAVAFVCRVVLLAAGAAWGTRYFLTPCRLDALAVGALVAMWLRAPGSDVAVRVERRMRRVAVVAGVVLVVLGVRAGGLLPSDPLVATIGYSAVAWLFGWLVAAAAVYASPFLRAPALVTAGRYSYGLYVLHPLVAAVSIAWLPRLNGGLRGAMVMWAGSAALAWVSYHGLEQRFLRLKDRLAPMRSPDRLEGSADRGPGSPPIPRGIRGPGSTL